MSNLDTIREVFPNAKVTYHCPWIDTQVREMWFPQVPPSLDTIKQERERWGIYKREKFNKRVTSLSLISTRNNWHIYKAFHEIVVGGIDGGVSQHVPDGQGVKEPPRRNFVRKTFGGAPISKAIKVLGDSGQAKKSHGYERIEKLANDAYVKED